MRIRITIEYDPDMEDTTTPEDKLEEETQDWINEHVTINDIIATDGAVKFEIV